MVLLFKKIIWRVSLDLDLGTCPPPRSCSGTGHNASLDAFDACADRSLKGTLFPLPHQELTGTGCPASWLPSLWEGCLGMYSRLWNSLPRKGVHPFLCKHSYTLVMCFFMWGFFFQLMKVDPPIFFSKAMILNLPNATIHLIQFPML